MNYQVTKTYYLCLISLQLYSIGVSCLSKAIAMIFSKYVFTVFILEVAIFQDYFRLQACEALAGRSSSDYRNSKSRFTFGGGSEPRGVDGGMNTSCTIMPTVDAGLGHRFIRTLKHPLRSPAKRQVRASRKIRLLCLQAGDGLRRFACSAATPQQSFYGMFFNKRPPGDEFQYCRSLTCYYRRRGTSPAGCIISVCQDAGLDGRFPRLLAYGGAHRSDVPEQERRRHGCDGTAEEGSGGNQQRRIK